MIADFFLDSGRHSKKQSYTIRHHMRGYITKMTTEHDIPTVEIAAPNI